MIIVTSLSENWSVIDAVQIDMYRSTCDVNIYIPIVPTQMCKGIKNPKVYQYKNAICNHILLSCQFSAGILATAPATTFRCFLRSVLTAVNQFN